MGLNILIDLPLTQPMDELFAVIAKDSLGNEGIMSFNGMPLVFGEMGTLKGIIHDLENIGKQAGKEIQLCRYKRTEIIKELK